MVTIKHLFLVCFLSRLFAPIGKVEGEFPRSFSEGSICCWQSLRADKGEGLGEGFDDKLFFSEIKNLDFSSLSLKVSSIDPEQMIFVQNRLDQDSTPCMNIFLYNGCRFAQKKRSNSFKDQDVSASKKRRPSQILPVIRRLKDLADVSDQGKKASVSRANCFCSSVLFPCYRESSVVFGEDHLRLRIVIVSIPKINLFGLMTILCGECPTHIELSQAWFVLFERVKKVFHSIVAQDSLVSQDLSLNELEISFSVFVHAAEKDNPDNAWFDDETIIPPYFLNFNGYPKIAVNIIKVDHFNSLSRFTFSSPQKVWEESSGKFMPLFSSFSGSLTNLGQSTPSDSLSPVSSSASIVENDDLGLKFTT